MRPGFAVFADLRWLALATLLYYLSARFGMLVFALQPSNISLLWLASGIGLVMAMRSGWRAMPLIVLASLAANVPGLLEARPLGQPWLHALVSALADGFSPCLAASLLRWRLPAGLRQARDLGPFILYACLIPSGLGALVIASNMAWGGFVPWPGMPDLLRSLTIADSLGILLIYPLYQAWHDEPWPNRLEWGWMFLAGLSSLAMLGLAFGGYSGIIYCLPAALVLLVFKARAGGVLLILLLAVVSTLALAARQLGPFAIADAEEARFMLMGFVFSTSFIVLCLALHRRQLEELNDSREHWRHQALRDGLTGLANRRAFMAILAAEQQRAVRASRPFALAMLDLDHFKRVNDQHGHAAGDLVLVELARLLRAQLRDIDVAARIGGEEFALLLPESTAAQSLAALERIRTAVQALPLSYAGQPIGVTVSIGVSEFIGGVSAASIQQLLCQADEQLYAAKQGGRNRICRA